MYFIYIHTKNRLTYTNTHIHTYTKTLVKNTKKIIKKKKDKPYQFLGFLTGGRVMHQTRTI